MAKVKRTVSEDQLARQQSWVLLHGHVYDVAGFLNVHPGGRAVLEQVGGRDGTGMFQAVHPKSLLDRLPHSVELVGEFVGSAPQPNPVEEGIPEPALTLDEVLNLNEMEIAAKQRMTAQGYAYYASAACDEITKRENVDAFSRAWLRPRVMVDVLEVDTSCTMLNCPLSFPVFISPAAMAGFANEDAECALARAAGSQGVLQIISYMSSRDLEEIAGARAPGQVQWFQLYVNPDRSKTEDILRRAEAAGCAAVVVTVDTNVLGRRERDMRVRGGSAKALAARSEGRADTSRGVAASLGNFIDARLSWKDVSWLRSRTRLPLLLKGVQSGEDALLAAEHGLDAIIVSNHGGRQLDQVRPTLDVLAEVMEGLRARGLQGSMEVYLDGGVRRGTDIYKALALGARAVGIGRPPMYALSFGQAGVERCLELLRDEFTTCMQLMGRRSLSEIKGEDVVFKAATTTASGDNEHARSRL